GVAGSFQTPPRFAAGSSMSFAVAETIAGALEEAFFFFGERGQPLPLYLFEQRVEPALLGDAFFLLALQAAGLAALLPALPPALTLAGRRGFVLFQARVALREVVTEDPLLASRLQHDQLVLASHVDEDR